MLSKKITTEAAKILQSNFGVPESSPLEAPNRTNEIVPGIEPRTVAARKAQKLTLRIPAK